MTGTDHVKALDAALAQIERKFGKGAVMRLGERPNEPIEVIPTGSTALDVALGVGGLPRGRVVEVYGPESSGKTTLTLHAVANAQKAGGQVAFIDAEHALDPEYAKKLGVDIDNLILSQPDNGEQALEIVDMLVRSGALDLIVIDSVAALVPRAEIEGEMGDSHVGLQARLMSQALRKITGALSQTRTTAIFINQLREKIGVMFGSPETTTGGRALKFYASVRLDIRRIETLKDGTDAVGNRTRVKVVKNKVSGEDGREDPGGAEHQRSGGRPMNVWIAIALTAIGCYLAKLLGLLVPAGALERPVVQRLAALLPVALLAALTAQQAFGTGQHLVLDARGAGLAAAALALVLRAPFLVVVGVAVAVTAGVRALG
ncbi:recombinase RecA [Streptomyces sp. or43]|nr:recombinase RecA [Streptomyces sp. or43]